MTQVVRQYGVRIVIGIVLTAILFAATKSWIPIRPEKQTPRVTEAIDAREVRIDEISSSREFDGDTPEHFNKNIKPLVDGIAKSSTVTVYEGMVRQLSEKEEIELGLIHRTPLIRHGYAFYEAAIPVEESNVATFTALFGRARTFARYTGPKFCGGFHPDWCVEFSGGHDIYRVLICFSCREARLYGPTNEVFTDFESAKYNDFIDILEPLHKELPMRQRTQ